MKKYWIGVVSREHVLRGKKEGIAQVCHGKQAPLKRMKPGDWLIYYSPVEKFGQKTPCRKFTAIGKVEKSEPYQVHMSETFVPWRRDIAYEKNAHEIAIETLLDKLTFIKNKTHWGFVFRYGLFEISLEDFSLIASNMGIFTYE